MPFLDSWDNVFATQDREFSKSIVVTPRSEGSNVGTRGHDAGHISFPI